MLGKYLCILYRYKISTHEERNEYKEGHGMYCLASFVEQRHHQTNSLPQNE